MSGIDVRDLANEKLPAGKFPVDPRADFRLFIAPEVRRGIEEHAKADVTVEICGVLVGNWGADENGPYAAVTDYIRCANAASKFAEVTFTHESWAQINKEMDSKFADSRIIGWYHSHPDFGIFLSERDAFIQEHFFSGPGQVAYVIDPVRDLEGVFAWRGGKPKPMPHFWIGNTVRTVEASERGANSGMAAHGQATGAGAAQQAEQKSWDTSPFGMATIVLGVLTLFLMGYLYGGWRAHSEEELARQEAVARLADIGSIRMTHEAELQSVRKRLDAVSESLSKIPQPGDKLSKKELEEAGVRRKSIQQQLKLSGDHLRRAQTLSDTEWAVYSRFLELKVTELARIMEEINAAQKRADADRKADAKQKASKDSSPAGQAPRPKEAAPKDQPSAPAGERTPVQAPPAPPQTPAVK